MKMNTAAVSRISKDHQTTVAQEADLLTQDREIMTEEVMAHQATAVVPDQGLTAAALLTAATMAAAQTTADLADRAAMAAQVPAMAGQALWEAHPVTDRALWVVRPAMAQAQWVALAPEAVRAMVHPRPWVAAIMVHLLVGVAMVHRRVATVAAALWAADKPTVAVQALWVVALLVVMVQALWAVTVAQATAALTIAHVVVMVAHQTMAL